MAQKTRGFKKNAVGLVVACFALILTVAACSPIDLAIIGGSALVDLGASHGINKIAESQAERVAKENNSTFTPGVANEEIVRSVLDPNGKPVDEMEFKDVTPPKKILFYERSLNQGKSYKVLLFAFDKDKNQYIFWDKVTPTEIQYSEFNQKKDVATKYYKAGWYLQALLKQIKDHNQKGQFSASAECASKLAEQKSEYDDINAEALNSTSWFWATCKDPRFRDTDKGAAFSDKAVEYARKANNLRLTALYLDTQAAVYAEKGDFKKAAELETEAYNIALDKNSGVPLESLNSFKQLADVYKTGKTYAVWKYGEQK